MRFQKAAESPHQPDGCRVRYTRAGCTLPIAKMLLQTFLLVDIDRILIETVVGAEDVVTVEVCLH
jgi:hypothetical protein